MTECRYKNAIIRIHGSYDLENVKAATTTFLKKAEEQRKKCAKQEAQKAVTA